MMRTNNKMVVVVSGGTKELELTDDTYYGF